MAKCRNCGSDIGGGFFKKYNEGVVTVKISILTLRYCSEACRESHAISIMPKVSERDQRREDRRSERQRLREENSELK